MDASLIKSLYIHFPFCKSRCLYCDFFARLFKDHSLENYFHSLESSIQTLKVLFCQKNFMLAPLETLYLGGGTPSLLGEKGLVDLISLLKKHDIQAPFLQKEYEWTIELNPESLSLELLEKALSLGFNRFSLGVQTLDEKVLKLLGRESTLYDIYSSLELLKKLKVNFNVDIMLGLPETKPRRAEREIQEILDFHPSHISLYILTLKKTHPFISCMPPEDDIADEYLNLSSLLKNSDFIHYEVSNFAKKGFESKHNFKYWLGENMAALGPDATGLIRLSKLQGLRYKWNRLGDSLEFENLGEDELKLEALYLGLRTNRGIHYDTHYDELYETWDKRGLMESRNERIILNSKGMLMLDSLLDEYFIFGKKYALS